MVGTTFLDQYMMVDSEGIHYIQQMMVDSEGQHYQMTQNEQSVAVRGKVGAGTSISSADSGACGKR